MNALTNTLYWISNGLLLPVIACLLVAFVWAVVLLGGALASHQARRRLTALMNGINQSLETTKPQDVDYSKLQNHHPALAASLARIGQLNWNPVHADKVLADFQMQAERGLRPSQLLMRLGPMLGLMGTLIPMGPALVGLAIGDIQSMAASMQVAFATTVIGVFSGGVGYLTLLFRKHWFAQDVNALQYIVELAEAPEPPEAPVAPVAPVATVAGDA